MTDPDVIETIIEQGEALVRAVVAVLPDWVVDEILSASQHVRDDWAVEWMRER